jgi:hypothetical protein
MFFHAQFWPFQLLQVLINAHANTSNKNVELGGRDAFKRFKHGVTGCVLGERRADGEWHIAMARQLHVGLCTFPELSQETRADFACAHEALFIVHHALKNPLPRSLVGDYNEAIEPLLRMMVAICQPHTKGLCNSIKHHWPRHWALARLQLGCAAEEKSLERKLGQSQKRNFRFTNKQEDTCEVRNFTSRFVMR